MTTATLTDDQADDAAHAILNLAETVRAGSPTATRTAVDLAITASGDPHAALALAAALIRIDQPIDRWWQRRTKTKRRRDRLAATTHIPRPGDRRAEVERLTAAGVRPATIAQLMSTHLDAARMGRA